MPDISEYPLPIAILVAAFWAIQQIIAANSKQIVALIDAFDKDYSVLLGKYETLFQMVWEDRQDSRQRWLERDRQLVAIAQDAKEGQLKNVNETHKLRSTLQPIVTSVQQMYRFIEAIYHAVVPRGKNDASN